MLLSVNRYFEMFGVAEGNVDEKGLGVVLLKLLPSNTTGEKIRGPERDRAWEANILGEERLNVEDDLPFGALFVLS